MKVIFFKLLVLSLFYSQISFATDIAKVNSFDSYSLTKISKIAGQIENLCSEGDLVFVKWGAKLLDPKKSVSYKKLITKMLNRLYTEWAKPEFINIKRIEVARALEEVDMFDDHLFTFYNSFWDQKTNSPKFKSSMKSLKKFLKRDYRNWKIFLIAHGNSFGASNGIVIVNNRTLEMIAMESIWSE